MADGLLKVGHVNCTMVHIVDELHYMAAQLREVLSMLSGLALRNPFTVLVSNLQGVEGQ